MLLRVLLYLLHSYFCTSTQTAALPQASWEVRGGALKKKNWLLRIYTAVVQEEVPEKKCWSVKLMADVKNKEDNKKKDKKQKGKPYATKLLVCEALSY